MSRSRSGWAAALLLSTLLGCNDRETPTAVVVPTGTAAAPSPALSKLAPPTGRPRDISFDDIKFPMEVGAAFEKRMITPAIEALSGKRIRLRGYILPSFQQTGITQFVLVRDNMQCCFGPGAALYDCVIVQMAAGKTTDYTVRPVAVTGMFAVHEWRDDFTGKCLAIYRLDGEQVQ